jgi:hypothetical protein
LLLYTTVPEFRRAVESGAQTVRHAILARGVLLRNALAKVVNGGAHVARHAGAALQTEADLLERRQMARVRRAPKQVGRDGVVARHARAALVVRGQFVLCMYVGERVRGGVPAADARSSVE